MEGRAGAASGHSPEKGCCKGNVDLGRRVGTCCNKVRKLRLDRNERGSTRIALQAVNAMLLE